MQNARLDEALAGIKIARRNINNRRKQRRTKEPFGQQENQPWIFTGRTDVEAEAPILWPPGAKSRLIGKDPDAGKDWGKKEKGVTEDECLNGIIDSMDMSWSKLREIDKDREARGAVVHGVEKSWTQLSDWITTRDLNIVWKCFAFIGQNHSMFKDTSSEVRETWVWTLAWTLARLGKFLKPLAYLASLSTKEDNNPFALRIILDNIG